MNQDNNDGLEFDDGEYSGTQDSSSTEDKSQLKNMLRDSYRLPVKALSSIRLHINQLEFVPVNLVAAERIGIGIMLEENTIFSEGDKLTNMQLSLEGKDIFVQGIVQHISPNGNGNYLCGIELIDLIEKDFASLQQFSKKCYSKLFKK